MKLQKVSHFSAFARPDSHLTKQTYSGAIVTICGALLALTLFIHEINHFYHLHRAVKLNVDTHQREDLDINLDMTLFAVPCAALNILAMDISGTFQDDQSASSSSAVLDLHRHRVDSRGRRIGRDEFHSPPTERLVDAGGFGTIVAIDIREALLRAHEAETESEHHEGCRVFGRVRMRRVAGRIVVAAQRESVVNMLAASAFFRPDGRANATSAHVPHLQALTNMSHAIQHFSFGPRVPGIQNPLDGQRLITTPEEGAKVVKYFLKVVPTQYFGRIGRPVETQQYAVTEYIAPLISEGRGAMPTLPTIEFHFDISPILMTINERPPSLLHFLVRMSAVVGGAVAVTGMLEKVVQFVIRLVNDDKSSSSQKSAAAEASPSAKYGDVSDPRLSSHAPPPLGGGHGGYGNPGASRSRTAGGPTPYGGSGPWY